ncbi:MAG TPA: hypothetical protein DEH22_03220 [Chloroflexi bacterium]|nr:hypothetical protein [Chloroflexota bacterium]
MNNLRRLFNVETGEGRLVGLLFFHSFLLGVANNFVQTAAFALFMVQYGAQKLAWVYIINALVLPLLTFVYLRLGKRISFSSLLAVNLGFLLVLISTFRLGLGVSGANWVIFALPILFQILVNFGNLEFWTLAGRSLNMRQGKRLFGLIGAGQWLAIVLTGLMIPWLVGRMGTANLLLISAGAMAAALVLVMYFTRSFSQLLSTPAPSPQQKTEQAKTSSKFWKNRYVILIFTLVVLWWVSFFFIDNIFYDRAAAQYPNAEALASFQGFYLAALGVITLFSNTFLSGFIINRFGERVSLLILPVSLVVGVSLMALTGTTSASVLMLFWGAVVVKLLDMSLGFSVDRSAQVLLYQPLPPTQRGQVQALAEGMFQPFANGLTGVVLLVLAALFGSNRMPMLYALSIIVIIWLVVAIALGREYPQMLMKALSRRHLGDANLPVADRASVEVLQQGLHNPHPGVVIYAMHLLKDLDPAALEKALPGLLEHPTPEVRQETLAQIESLKFIGAVEAVRQRVTDEPDPAIRGMSIRTLTMLDGREISEEVIRFLADPEPQVKRGALIGLLRNGSDAGRAAAKDHLLAWTDSLQASERRLAAQVWAETDPEEARPPLEKLLNDAEIPVQRAALQTAGRLQIAALWPLVLQKLEGRATRKAAAAALVTSGDQIIPELAASFADCADCTELQLEFVKVMQRIGSDQAVRWLQTQITHPTPEIRTEVLEALSHLQYQPQGAQVNQISAQIKAEAAQQAELYAILVDIGDSEKTALLRGTLAEKIRQGLERIFYLLSFLYERRAILNARDNLWLASGEKKSYALEMIDVAVAPALKKMVMPLLANASNAEKLGQLGVIFPQQQKSASERLKEITNDKEARFSAWTKTCARYAAGESPDMALNEMEKTMLSNIEKVLALKQVGIFTETSNETLAQIAQLLDEVSYSDGKAIFEKGDLGDSMYIIIAGEVRVHDGERTLNHLKTGDVFGESAVLDAEPRMASITAVAETQLLRLSQEDLYEVMEAQSEISRGIIRVLSKHLRDRVKDLNDLSS